MSFHINFCTLFTPSVVAVLVFPYLTVAGELISTLIVNLFTSDPLKWAPEQSV
jgi:hypothetical protein